jgi:hypothetical protein
VCTVSPPVPVEKVVRAAEPLVGTSRECLADPEQAATAAAGPNDWIDARQAWDNDCGWEGQAGDRGRSGGAFVSVVEARDLGDCHDTPGQNWLYLTPAWAVVA